MSRYLGEMLAFIILFLLILMMIMGGEMFYDMSTYNAYRNQVVKIAQRSNGYTPAVQAQMNDLAKFYYNTGKQHKFATEPYGLDTIDIRQKDSQGHEQVVGHRFNVPQANSTDCQNAGYNLVNYGHPIKFQIIMQIPTFMTILPTSKSNFHEDNAYRGADVQSHVVSVRSQTRDTPTFSANN